jgi:hypothetical protein
LLAAWVPIGPAPQHDPNSTYPGVGDTTGRISALAISTNYDGLGHQALLAGEAGGGLWRSTDFASSSSPTWTTLTDFVGLPTDTANGFGSGAIDVGAVAVDPNNQRTIYVGTGEANLVGDSRYGSGILKSTDGGNTWPTISRGPSNAFFRHSISSIFVDTTNSNTLYASVIVSGAYDLTNLPQDPLTGIYKSTDAGQTWRLITGAGANKIGANLTVTSLDYIWAAPNSLTIYAGVVGKGVYRSSDGGATWDFRDAGLGDAGKIGRISLAASHVSGVAYVYAAVAKSDSTLLGVYESTDAGDHWRNTSAPDFAAPRPTTTWPSASLPAGGFISAV